MPWAADHIGFFPRPLVIPNVLYFCYQLVGEDGSLFLNWPADNFLLYGSFRQLLLPHHACTITAIRILTAHMGSKAPCAYQLPPRKTLFWFQSSLESIGSELHDGPFPITLFVSYNHNCIRKLALSFVHRVCCICTHSPGIPPAFLFRTYAEAD